MSLTFDTLINHPDLHEAIRDQSRAFLEIHERSPKLAAVFGTQQRWLMGHLAMAQYFSSAAASTEEPVVLMARFFEQVRQYKIASVNTADAFMKEMIVYGIGQLTNSTDRRNRPIVPSPQTIEGVHQWVMIHLNTLDRLDGGTRLNRYQADTRIINLLHPRIVDSFLTSSIIRDPPQTFTLFTWLNNGGIVLDWLLAGIEPAAPDADRVPTQLRSVPLAAQTFRLSRTHLTRKLREAEALGSIGWEGTRGRSTMWVSKEFRHEYATAQVGKLLLIDEACAQYDLR